MQLADKHKWNSNGKYTCIILPRRLYEELEIIPGKTHFRNRGEGKKIVSFQGTSGEFSGSELVSTADD